MSAKVAADSGGRRMTATADCGGQRLRSTVDSSGGRQRQLTATVDDGDNGIGRWHCLPLMAGGGEDDAATDGRGSMTSIIYSLTRFIVLYLAKT